jgi:hypothetical protein
VLSVTIDFSIFFGSRIDNRIKFVCRRLYNR